MNFRKPKSSSLLTGWSILLTAHEDKKCLSNQNLQNRLTSSTFSTMFQPMTLTQYGRMAEKHWREFLPNRVRELEAKSQLQEALYEAEEKTKDEMDQAMRDFRKQGYTTQQAH